MKIIRSAVRIQQLLDENKRLTEELAQARAKVLFLEEELEDYMDSVDGLNAIIEDNKDKDFLKPPWRIT